MAQKAGTFVDIFDFIAEQIRYLQTLNPRAWQNKTVRNTIVPPPDLDDAVSTLFEEHPVLNNAKELIRRGIPCDTADSIRRWKYSENFSGVLEFLAHLTRKIPVEDILKYSSAAKERDGFEALNRNAAETGLQIAPKVSSINDPLDPANEGGAEDHPEEPAAPTEKHWAAERCPGINEELSNIMYIETERLRIKGVTFKVKNHIVGDDFFAGGKKELVIGVSPLAKGDFLEVARQTRAEGEDRRRFFNITGLKNEGVVKDRLEAAAIEACTQDVDILVLPEMLGSGEIVSHTFADQIVEKAAEAELPMPSIILWPTWWHDFHNELYVTDGSGAQICIQHKQYPFDYMDEKTGEHYAEDLQNTERIIHVIHIQGLGRLTFPICRDYLETEYLHLMAELLKSTFLFCPSYSRGKTQFDLAAPGEIKYGCYTVWINTCAARHGTEDCPSYVGLVSGPLAEGDYIKRLRPTCGGNCGGQKDACLFLIRISMDHLASISCTHMHGGNIMVASGNT